MEYDVVTAVTSSAAAVVAAIAAWQAKRATDQAGRAAQAAVDLTEIERERLAQDRIDRATSTGFKAYEAPLGGGGRLVPIGEPRMIRLKNLGPGTAEITAFSLCNPATDHVDPDAQFLSGLPLRLDAGEVCTIRSRAGGALDVFVEWTDGSGSRSGNFPVDRGSD